MINHFKVVFSYSSYKISNSFFMFNKLFLIPVNLQTNYL